MDYNDENEMSENNVDIPEHHNQNLPSGRKSSGGVPKRLRQINNNESRNLGVPKNDKKKDDGNTLAKSKIANNKNTKKGFFSRYRKTQKGNNDTTKEEEKEKKEADTPDTSNSDSQEELGGVIARIRHMRRMLTLIGTSILAFFFIFVLMIIVGAIASIFGTPISALNSYGTKDFAAVSTVNTKEYKEEVAYYSKLKEKAKEFEKKCGGEFNINLLHASIVYYYYKIDVPNDFNGSDKSIIDYNKMAGVVDKFAKIMYGDSCDTDYTINGSLYKKFKNSSDFRNYYSEVLKKEKIDDILNDIFSIAETINVKDDMPVDTNFIPENAVVTVDSSTSNTSNGLNSGQSSTGGNNSSGSSSGHTGSSGSSGNSGTKSGSNTNKNITSVTFKEYILGVLYANLSKEDLENNEKIKAYAIAYTTNVLVKNKLTLNNQTIALDNDNDILYCNVDEGCSYTTKGNKKILQVGSGKSGNGNTIFYEGKYYYHIKMDSEKKKLLNKLVDEVYGIVLVNSDGKQEEVDALKISKSQLVGYEEILKEAYPNLTTKLIRENVYDNGVNYGNKKVTPATIFYEQTDYGDVFFCHRKNVPLSKNSIASSGCGTTAMSILVSSYENSKKYDPIYTNERAWQTGNCGYSNGTFINFFKVEAEHMKYKYLRVGSSKTSDKNLVTTHLSMGHLIIARVGPGKFTSSGHYIVLAGIDPDTKSIYVLDPYNRRNKINGRNSGNGWYSFNNVIAKDAAEFYIIWKE